jgi:mannose-6-phosphate isomerase-like protein (cupin superfamily)
MTEIATEKFLMRRLSEVQEERGVCGFRRTLITAADTPAVNVSHLRIDNSRYHYHGQMTELYYVLSGSGTITLDGDTYPVQAGDIVLIRPGVWHTSEGDMNVLITGVPAGEATDIFFE